MMKLSTQFLFDLLINSFFGWWADDANRRRVRLEVRREVRLTVCNDANFSNKIRNMV